MILMLDMPCTSFPEEERLGEGTSNAHKCSENPNLSYLAQEAFICQR